MQEAPVNKNLKEQQIIEQYINAIQSRLKKGKICFIVAQCLVVLSTIVNIAVILGVSEKTSYSIGTYIGFGVWYNLTPLINLLSIWEFSKNVHNRNDYDKRIAYILHIIIWCPLLRLVIGTMISGADICAYMTGLYWGFAAIPNLVGYIFIILAYIKSEKKWKSEFEMQMGSEYVEKQKSLTRGNKKQKLYDKDISALANIISKVGNKFFIKYYFELRDWEEPDIIDIIQEDYSEASKQQRIRKAKEIFDKGLNKLALQTIADISNNSVDDETRQNAQKILEQNKK